MERKIIINNDEEINYLSFLDFVLHALKIILNVSQCKLYFSYFLRYTRIIFQKFSLIFNSNFLELINKFKGEGEWKENCYIQKILKW